MGLFSSKYKGRITTWPKHKADGGGDRYGCACECGWSSRPIQDRRGQAESLLRKHMKNEHGNR